MGWSLDGGGTGVDSVLRALNNEELGVLQDAVRDCVEFVGGFVSFSS